MFHVKLLWFFLLISNYVFTQHYSLRLPAYNKLPAPHLDSTIYKFNSGAKEYNSLNFNEQQMYYWINYSRSNPKRFWDSAVVPLLKLFPQLKGASSESLEKDLSQAAFLPLLRLNVDLLKMAQFHANDLGKKQLPMSHNSSNGETFEMRFTKFVNKNCGSENLALGNDNMLFSLILLYLDYGLSTPAHRFTLLNTKYTNLGISVVPYGNSNQFFIVQDFSCP